MEERFGNSGKRQDHLSLPRMDPTCGSGRAKRGPSPFHTLQPRDCTVTPRRPCVIQQQMSKPTRQSAGTQRTPVSPRKTLSAARHSYGSFPDGRPLCGTYRLPVLERIAQLCGWATVAAAEIPMGTFLPEDLHDGIAIGGTASMPLLEDAAGSSCKRCKGHLCKIHNEREVTRATAPIEGKSFELRIFATGGPW
ncbi:uncharacterized protein K489DRAFT_51215 [Dissoconium aciculare CBS 342.82]|uniref:Uncharacterized protein n=1 Tax=Dissoconium aciculare CBS 342.82 TaxID=1314786 RepID=A0A6J3LX54_9PEZI|nr:uncharacterized protein K489DRAFT_51215 [Dissoconium aciculare CBS 342.82]KAF1820243.1 hypothetical protein K489DRAFT_51215 [Dissoconium aciculare CBS 342.82]